MTRALPEPKKEERPRHYVGFDPGEPGGLAVRVVLLVHPNGLREIVSFEQQPVRRKTR